MAARLTGPDQLRGLLLVLVIYGHTYALGLLQDLSKWFVYGFHMPLFLVLSGWVWRRTSLLSRSLPGLLGYFWRRMLWQWLVVATVFAAWQGTWPDSVGGFLRLYLLQPDFHLWFVPALVLMVMTTSLVFRVGLGWRTLTVLCVVVTVAVELPTRALLLPGASDVVDLRYGSYLPWFVLGTAVRNAPWSFLRTTRPRVWVPVAGVGLVVYLAGFFLIGSTIGSWVRDVGFLTLNVALGLGLPTLLLLLRRPLPVVGAALVTVGRRSLWVYLLHPFVIIPISAYDDGGVVFRLVAVVATGLVVAFTVLADRFLQLSRSARGGGTVEGEGEGEGEGGVEDTAGSAVGDHDGDPGDGEPFDGDMGGYDRIDPT